MKIVTIVQARTGSTRLPGKVLLPLAGRPLLQRMLERLQEARLPSAIVVATTIDPSDDPVRKLCSELGVKCYSGHPADLLDRHYQAATIEDAEIAVKIPSDCPLIDPDVVDRVLSYFVDNFSRFDFVSNLHPPTYPDGEDVEAMSMNALEAAWRLAGRPLEREHTTPYLWERPEEFRIGNVTWETGNDFSMSHRWTIDYPEDYRFLAAVYDALYTPGAPIFGIGTILEYLEQHPEVAAINSRYAGVNWYRNHLDELQTIDPSMTKQYPR